MGHRLSKIYTRTGDAGTTGLGDGSRAAKTDIRIQTLGDIDELNSAVGILLAAQAVTGLNQLLLEIQHDLFDLGGEVAIPGSSLLPAGAVERLEAAIDSHNAALPPLKEFILPSGSLAAAQCHFARAVCRRAERSLVGLTGQADVGARALQYLNRLSDLLFVLARIIARADGGQEVMWNRARFHS
ncbi:MAG: cob(I)yrinic acid a,c-diamide adenosyltransferase [Gammaproteobacteria bacterium]|nr:cob(I)yrinic acid a,c-diamide adenosyltransferase [Gammaproteobacteria bacterium]